MAVWFQAADNTSLCERVYVYQGALPNKAVSLHIYKKYNWQHVNDELAIRTACEKGRRTGPRAPQHVLCLTHCGRGQHNIALAGIALAGIALAGMSEQNGVKLSHLRCLPYLSSR